MDDKIAQAAAGFVIGSLADTVLVQLGLPKHAAKIIGTIIGALI